jgi:hypothetical protein
LYGTHCTYQCQPLALELGLSNVTSSSTDGEVIEAAVVWMGLLDGYNGFVDEIVNFVVPLAPYIESLGLDGMICFIAGCVFDLVLIGWWLL